MKKVYYYYFCIFPQTLDTQVKSFLTFSISGQNIP